MANNPNPPVNRWKTRKLGGCSGASINRDQAATIGRIVGQGRQTADAFRRDDIGALRRIEKTKGR